MKKYIYIYIYEYRDVKDVARFETPEKDIIFVPIPLHPAIRLLKETLFPASKFFPRGWKDGELCLSNVVFYEGVEGNTSATEIHAENIDQRTKHALTN